MANDWCVKQNVPPWHMGVDFPHEKYLGFIGEKPLNLPRFRCPRCNRLLFWAWHDAEPLWGGEWWPMVPAHKTKKAKRTKKRRRGH